MPQARRKLRGPVDSGAEPARSAAPPLFAIPADQLGHGNPPPPPPPSAVPPQPHDEPAPSSVPRDPDDGVPSASPMIPAIASDSAYDVAVNADLMSGPRAPTGSALKRSGGADVSFAPSSSDQNSASSSKKTKKKKSVSITPARGRSPVEPVDPIIARELEDADFRARRRNDAAPFEFDANPYLVSAVVLSICAGLGEYLWSSMIVAAPSNASRASFSFARLAMGFGAWTFADIMLDILCEVLRIPMGSWYAQLPQKYVIAAALPLVGRSACDAFGGSDQEVSPAVTVGAVAISAVFGGIAAQRLGLIRNFGIEGADLQRHAGPRNTFDSSRPPDSASQRPRRGFSRGVTTTIAAFAIVTFAILLDSAFYHGQPLSVTPRALLAGLARLVLLPVEAYAAQVGLFMARTCPDIVPMTDADTAVARNPYSSLLSDDEGDDEGDRAAVPTSGYGATETAATVGRSASIAEAAESRGAIDHSGSLRAGLRKLVIGIKLPVSFLRQLFGWATMCGVALVAVDQLPDVFGVMPLVDGAYVRGWRSHSNHHHHDGATSFEAAWAYLGPNIAVAVAAVTLTGIATLMQLHFVQTNIARGLVCIIGPIPVTNLLYATVPACGFLITDPSSRAAVVLKATTNCAELVMGYTPSVAGGLVMCAAAFVGLARSVGGYCWFLDPKRFRGDDAPQPSRLVTSSSKHFLFDEDPVEEAMTTAVQSPTTMGGAGGFPSFHASSQRQSFADLFAATTTEEV